MKKFVTLLTLLSIATLTGCSESKDGTKDNTEKTSIQSNIEENTTGGSSSPVNQLSEVSLHNFSSITGKLFTLSHKYVGDSANDFSQISWEPSDDQQCYFFLDENRFFAGNYTDGKLTHGRIYSIDSVDETGIITLSNGKYICSSTYLNTEVTENDRTSFLSIDQSQVPDADPNETYFESNEYRTDVAKRTNRFYLSSEGYVVRENIGKDSKLHLVRYSVK